MLKTMTTVLSLVSVRFVLLYTEAHQNQIGDVAITNPSHSSLLCVFTTTVQLHNPVLGTAHVCTCMCVCVRSHECTYMYVCMHVLA